MKNHGMTLIETLLYMAIFSLIMTSFITVAFALERTFASVHTHMLVLRNERFITDYLSATVASADSVMTPAAGETSTELSTMNDGGITTDHISTSSLMRVAAGTTSPLSEPGVQVTGISFARIRDRNSDRIIATLSLLAYEDDRPERATSTWIMYLHP